MLSAPHNLLPLSFQFCVYVCAGPAWQLYPPVLYNTTHSPAVLHWAQPDTVIKDTIGSGGFGAFFSLPVTWVLPSFSPALALTPSTGFMLVDGAVSVEWCA